MPAVARCRTGIIRSARAASRRRSLTWAGTRRPVCTRRARLLDGRTADVHTLGSATFQSHVPAERVERAWRTRTQDLGPAGQVTVRCQGPVDYVVADVTIAFARDAVAVRIGFEPSGQLSGLRVLPPQED
jgi:hypothetical protein